MKIGKRESGHASCEVNFCKALPAKMRTDIREVTSVEVDPAFRGQGEATRLLEQVCREADKFKMILVVVVDPYGDDAPMTKEQLANWYGSTFDFDPIQQEPLILARMWQPFKKPLLAEKVSQIILEGVR